MARVQYQQQLPAQILADYLAGVRGGAFGEARLETPRVPLADIAGGAQLGRRIFGEAGGSIAPILGGLLGGLGGLG